jgi:hypothetical protein
VSLERRITSSRDSPATELLDWANKTEIKATEFLFLFSKGCPSLFLGLSVFDMPIEPAHHFVDILLVVVIAAVLVAVWQENRFWL